MEDTRKVPDVAIVISTYNRCDMLPEAIASVLAQEAKGVRYELIVVDNNSTDDTKSVVEGFIARYGSVVRYVLERKQGLSHARNAGIAATNAPIIVFTDDDVRAASDWVINIKRAFDQHPKADFVGGKVLPRWNQPPPAWLTKEHWSPLALLDYGDASFYVDRENSRCLVGANLAFRREVFDRIGFFEPKLQRVKDGIGSTEDHEFLIRVWQAGGVGLYSPDVVITADVQTERMSKSYHRRWHAGHGRFTARMRLRELIDRKGHLIDQPIEASRFFGMPIFIFRDLPYFLKHYFLAIAQRRESDALKYETELRSTLNYLRQSRRLINGQ